MINIIALFWLWWSILGITGWIIGQITDSFFYIGHFLFDWDTFGYSLLFGPITWLIVFKSLLDHYLDKRKKNKKIPKDISQCLISLDHLLSKEDREQARKDPEFALMYHHSLGRQLRNDWGLWRGSKLKIYFQKLGIDHADDMSGIILTSYHRWLNNRTIELNKQIKEYQDYWEKENG